MGSTSLSVISAKEAGLNKVSSSCVTIQTHSLMRQRRRRVVNAIVHDDPEFMSSDENGPRIHGLKSVPRTRFTETDGLNAVLDDV